MSELRETVGASPDALASTILVGIPVLNEERHIEACLASLMVDAPAMRAVRFVVADGGSTDRTADIVRAMAATRPNLHLIANPGRLQSAALNRVAASELAGGRTILVRCDAHAVYPPDYVLDLARALERTGAASVVVPMDASGETCFARGAAWITDTRLGSGGSAHRGGQRSGHVDHGHHAAFDLGWFRRIDGYDPDFAHNEDAEFDRRLAQAGGRIWMESTIRLTYLMRPTLRRLARQYYNYGRGRMRTLLKHRMRPRLRQMVPVANLGWLVLCALVGLVVHPAAYLGILAYGLVLGAASAWVALTRRSACGLWAGPALAAMHLSWAVGAVIQVAAGYRR